MVVPYLILLIIVSIYLLGLLLMAILNDRYWGTELLGGRIKPRHALIYEGRPWWMKDVARISFTGAIATVIIVTPSAIFFPFVVVELLLPIGAIWIAFLLIIGVIVAMEKLGRDEISEEH